MARKVDIMIYPATEKYIEMAVNSLNDGDVIVYPTDTLYGFGADATNTKAINALNKIKKREQVYSIIVNSKSMLKEYADVSENCFKEIKQYFPGPFTMIFNKKETFFILFDQF